MSLIHLLDTSENTCESTSQITLTPVVRVRPASDKAIDLIEDHISRLVIVTSRLVVVECPSSKEAGKCIQLLKTHKYHCYTGSDAKQSGNDCFVYIVL